MKPIDARPPARPQNLAQANASNREVLFEEVRQVSSLHSKLDTLYRGARQPEMPGWIESAFSAHAADPFTLPRPAVSAGMETAPSAQEFRSDLRRLVRRHGVEQSGGAETSSASANSRGTAVVQMLTVLGQFSRAQTLLERGFASAKRS